ncbi:MAG: K+-transporting ATPase, subunit, partial [Candidatus Aminicenantes bacterium]|nr:K+-transporting ATPase, subunit [Candidatus Aminicenantes bacterium]
MRALNHPLFERALVGRAALAAVKKLDPFHLLKNPVIFVTEVGALLTTVGLMLRSKGEPAGFALQIALWLWFTVLFANFAEAMAESRG